MIIADCWRERLPMAGTRTKLNRTACLTIFSTTATTQSRVEVNLCELLAILYDEYETNPALLAEMFNCHSLGQSVIIDNSLLLRIKNGLLNLKLQSEGIAHLIDNFSIIYNLAIRLQFLSRRSS